MGYGLIADSEAVTLTDIIGRLRAHGYDTSAARLVDIVKTFGPVPLCGDVFPVNGATLHCRRPTDHKDWHRAMSGNKRVEVSWANDAVG